MIRDVSMDATWEFSYVLVLATVNGGGSNEIILEYANMASECYMPYVE